LIDSFIHSSIDKLERNLNEAVVDLSWYHLGICLEGTDEKCGNPQRRKAVF